MKIVLAYSGGLDTSVILKWLKENYQAEIIAFAADVGQAEELKGLKKKALATGASKIYVDDLQAEFAQDFIFPMMRANAIYEGQYFLGTSIARPLIAKRMVDELVPKLREDGKRARTITAKIRYPGMEDVSAGHSLPRASDLETDFYPQIAPLLRSAWKQRRPLRLLVTSYSNLLTGRCMTPIERYCNSMTKR